MQPELIGGRYRVESAIGRGGMGTVWLCQDETLHRHVAVKQVGLLPGESVTDSARAFREARSSAGLSHRNVVTVFDVVEEAGHIWLVMEHVPGRSLSQIIKQDGPLDPSTVAEIGAQVADGLSALHAGGILHRDVKPGNVLIREDGVAKISDFGISRTAGDATLTQSGYLTGTPSYFSPALARGAESAPADEVWALGPPCTPPSRATRRTNSATTPWRCFTRSPPPSPRTPSAPSSSNRPCCDARPRPELALDDGRRGAHPSTSRGRAPTRGNARADTERRHSVPARSRRIPSPNPPKPPSPQKPPNLPCVWRRPRSSSTQRRWRPHVLRPPPGTESHGIAGARC